MNYYPIITFNTADGKISYQAELNCYDINQVNWLLEEHDHVAELIVAKIAAAKVDLINKYSIEEI